MNIRVSVLALVLGVAVMAADKWPASPSIVPPDAQASVLAVKADKNDDTFMQVWKSPELKAFGFVKWDEDGSKAGKGVPDSFLPSVREACGLVNQKRASGNNLTLTINAYHWKAQTFITNPVVSLEILIKDKDGKVMLAALDEVKATQSKMESLSDPTSVTMSHEISKKLRAALNL